MATTFTKSSDRQSGISNRIIMYALESLIVFLMLFGAMSAFAQSTTESTKLDLAKQSVVFNSGKVYLNWVTKVNSSDCVYVIERSVDGDEYEPVGLKEGIGSPIELLYSWIDNSPKEGESFYRIKQINMEGKLMAQSTDMDMNTPVNPLFIDKGTRLVQVK
jgi:hypothetical protein